MVYLGLYRSSRESSVGQTRSYTAAHSETRKMTVLTKTAVAVEFQADDATTATARACNALVGIAKTTRTTKRAAGGGHTRRSAVLHIRIPFAVCARIAERYLSSSEAIALSRTCQDWYKVIESPLAWREVSFHRTLTAAQFIAALQEPKFKALRCLDIPSEKAKFGHTSFYSDINNCCPSLRYISLDVSKMCVDGTTELLDSMPSPLSVRGLRCRCCSWAWGARVTSMLLAGCKNLRSLFLHSFSGSFSSCIPHIGELAQLEHLAISVTTDQFSYWGGLSPEQSFDIDDAAFAPIAENCTKLQTLVLDGVFGIGGKTWQNFAKCNTALTHIRISWQVWSSIQQLRKTSCPIDFTVHPIFPQMTDFASFSSTVATLPSLKVFEYCPGTAIDRQVLMRGACKATFCKSLIDMLNWANSRPGERIWRVDDWPSIAQQNLPLYTGNNYHGLCLAGRYQGELARRLREKCYSPAESGESPLFFPTFRMLSCISDDCK